MQKRSPIRTARLAPWACRISSAILFFAAATGLRADAPAFDLAGPKVDVRVQRDGKTLPIAQVPNLMPGDRLWVHPDLPASQSTHYVLVVAFLRGSTNPPPADWYKRVETWNREARDEGVVGQPIPERGRFGLRRHRRRSGPRPRGGNSLAS